MKQCKCGSWAINHHMHGRDGTDDDLCDVCYWRKRAALAEQAEAEPQATPAWWRDGLTATLMREGINKHRAREIADGYWQAYCEIGGNDD